MAAAAAATRTRPPLRRRIRARSSSGRTRNRPSCSRTSAHKPAAAPHSTQSKTDAERMKNARSDRQRRSATQKNELACANPGATVV